MATPSGAPPAPTTNSKITTPEQKRLFILLGVGGVLALAVGGKFVLGALNGGSKTQATATNAALSNAATASNSAAPTGEGGPEGAAPANPAGVPVSAAAPAGGTTPAALLPLARYRRDPFQPFFILPPPPTPIPPPTPTPKPPPTPTPPPKPVEIPLPESVDVPTPGGGLGGFGNQSGGANGGGGASASSVPGVGGGSNSINQPLVLPGVVIPRLNARNTSPADAFPPPRSSSGGGSSVVSPSFGKRLSGVVIGNGVRAVLEISGGPTPKSYVVQPGDVVEGITVLSISRFNEGGNQVTRMLVRENGGERYVDLKAGPPRTAVGAGPGEGGAPGGPGFSNR